MATDIKSKRLFKDSYFYGFCFGHGQVQTIDVGEFVNQTATLTSSGNNSGNVYIGTDANGAAQSVDLMLIL